MKLYLILCLTIINWQLTQAASHNTVCYYDASSRDRRGIGEFSLADLENALDFCTHVVFGYVGINSFTFKINSNNVARDLLAGQHFKEVTSLKAKYPHIKFLLSLGGGRDPELNLSNKYLQLLEANEETQKYFIDSALNLTRDNKFDGLDLAYQFPRNIRNVKTVSTGAWKSLRKLFIKKSNDTVAKEKDYKSTFSNLVESLSKAFKPYNLMLTLTVLPNINTNLYFNASALIKNLDFVNLQTFDFLTPETSTSEASYTAPLFNVAQQGGASAEQTVDYQVNYWLSQHVPLNKLNVGIAAYGRAWSLTNDSKKNAFPKVLAVSGPAPASYITNLPGIYTWTEICPMLLNVFNVNKTGALKPLISVLDPHRDFVTYAFRLPDANGDYGMWISYDDPRIAAIKAGYVRKRRLAGVAIFDVALDDFRGICNGDTFPMLRYIKYTFS